MARPRKKAALALQLGSIPVLAALDQLLKYIVVQKLMPVGSVTAIPGFLAWTYAENTGAAFSMFSGSTVMLTVFTSLALAGGIVYLCVSKERPLLFDICLPLVLAGGAGNLLDRLTRGYVVDYIQVLFVRFPVFNFADCLVTCGAITLLVYLFYDLLRDLSRNKKTAAQTESENV